MARPKKVLLNLSLELDEKDFENLKTSANGDESKITAWCRWLLSEFSRGAMLVSSDTLKQIERDADLTISDQKQLLEIAQRAQKREDGQFSVTVPFDPAYMQNLQETAEMSGMTPEELATEMLMHAISSGWLYDWAPQGGQIALTDEDWRELQNITGKKSFSGSDVVACIRSRAEA